MLTNLEKAYIAGFLDGDGCIMFQLVRRKDYIYGYQIRASIVFYQNKSNQRILKWLKSKLKYGYLRERKDNMVEYTIVGKDYVVETVNLLQPYLKLKKRHANLTFKINELWPKRFSQKSLLKVAKLVDGFKRLNYSKKRKNTSKTLKEFFEIVPVTTNPADAGEIEGT
jgi:hypothetical protein